MNRTKKGRLLTRLVNGQLNVDSLRRLTQPTQVCGLLVSNRTTVEPLPADELKATLFYADGRIESRPMTYERFNQLPDTVSRVLLILPDNKRRSL